MIGISFPGISQLFVGGARPPHLAAIAPLSVIADIYRAPGFPGGIFNNGFAETWLQERKDDAEPAPEGGQGCGRQARARRRRDLPREPAAPPADPGPARGHRDAPLLHAVAHGRPLADQLGREDRGADVPRRRVAGRADRRRLRVDAVPRRRGGPTSRSPRRTASTRARSTRRSCGTGSRSSTSTSAGPRARSGPHRAVRLDHLLADPRHRRRPRRRCPPIASTASPTSTQARDAVRVRPARPRAAGERRRLADAGPSRRPRSSSASASGRRARRSRPPGTSAPRARSSARGRAERSSGSDDLPPRSRGAPGADHSRAGPVRVVGDPARTTTGARSSTGRPWHTPPIRSLDDVTIVGPGSVDLWLRSSAADTDLQVTLTEIRPDGLETYVQSGWLRASHRRLDRRRSTGLRSGADPSRRGRAAAAGRRVHQGPRRAVRVGARVPRRLAHPDQRRGARRRSHALAVRHAGDGRRGRERDRLHAGSTRRGSSSPSSAARSPRRRCHPAPVSAASRVGPGFRRETAADPDGHC